MKGKLNVDNCIMIHDLKQIRKEPPEKKIKTKRQLSKKMHKLKVIEGSESSIYTKLWRNEREGFIVEPKELINSILKVLEVSESDLVENFQD